MSRRIGRSVNTVANSSARRGIEPLVLLRWMRFAEADPDPDQCRAEQWHRQPERRAPAEQDRELAADDGTRDVTEAAAGMIQANRRGRSSGPATSEMALCAMAILEFGEAADQAADRPPMGR